MTETEPKYALVHQVRADEQWQGPWGSKRGLDYWMMSWKPGDGFKPLYRIKCVERAND